MNRLTSGILRDVAGSVAGMSRGDWMPTSRAAAAVGASDEPFSDVWQFDVRAGVQAEFLRHYGANGTWVKLFRHEPTFIETWLLQDAAIAGRFLSIDRWRSVDGYARFRARFATAYRVLDLAGEGLTSRARHLGAFLRGDAKFPSPDRRVKPVTLRTRDETTAQPSSPTLDSCALTGIHNEVRSDIGAEATRQR